MTENSIKGGVALTSRLCFVLSWTLVGHELLDKPQYSEMHTMKRLGDKVQDIVY